MIFLKGGDLKNETAGIKAAQFFSISDFFEEEFFKEKKVVYIAL
jgi:16S rRNA (guanine527-N7)-methyltransferase